MLSILIILFSQFVSSKKNFPSIKFTKGGIFGWFDALALMKKPFNNKKLFGFRLNSTEPDLSMIVYDIVNHLDLHDINISQKINDYFNNNNEEKSHSLLLSGGKCSEKTGNSKQFCKMFGNSIDFEKIGISENHLNILLANLVGYIPTNLFFIIIASLSIIYYIVQIVLQYRFFKPVEYSEPSIQSIIIFYAGDALVFISAILFLCAFTGVDNFVSTIVSLDTVVPRISYSIATSFEQLFEEEIPNGFHPIFEAFNNILKTTHSYIKSSIDSFINPTSLFLAKMVSDNESDLGVFNIYNDRIHPIANQFYTEAKKYENLKDLSQFFMSQDFSSEQKKFQDFVSSENDLSNQLNELDTFFVYFHSIAESMEEYINDFTNMTLDDDENKTVGESIRDLKDKSLSSFEFLRDLHKRTKKKNPLWIFLAFIFFTIGIFFMITPIFLGLIFWMHNKVSRCVANTIAICPLVSTVLMFVFSFLMTGVGFALVALSNQFEMRIDDFLSNIIDVTIPTREIVFDPINITKQTNGTYTGVLNLSSIVFPKKFDFFERFTKHDEDDGIVTALSINEIIDMNKYGDEIGDFIISLSSNFNLPDNILTSLNQVKDILKSLDSFPTQIDGLFNWLVPISKATNYLRDKIQSKEPSAMSELNPYLNEIDILTNKMNSQFEIGIQQLTQELPDSINQLNTVVPRFIKSVMKDLGTSTKDLARNVYPIINSIKSGMIIGPYALIRNVIFYDLSNMCAFVSASATLMIFGFVVVVTLIWIRRKGMIYETGREIGFFEFFCMCGKKKVANDHSCDSMETDDSNIIYLHDSDFEISTSRCDNDFEVSLGIHLKDLNTIDECTKWCINSNDLSDSLKEDDSVSYIPEEDINNWIINEDENGNYIPDNTNCYICDPNDNNENFCIKEDENGNYIPDNTNCYVCDPNDDNENFCIKENGKGKFIPDDSYTPDPAEDCSNWSLIPDEEGNFVLSKENIFVCDPEDDNNNFVVRLDREGNIYKNKFGEDHPIKDSINDVGETFINSIDDT